MLSNDLEPLSVAYSQHCSGQRRPWSHVLKQPFTDHPVDFVAAGSHANYFTPGEHPIDTDCIPPSALELLSSLGLAAPDDHVNPGQAYGPLGLEGVRTTEVRPTQDAARWNAFPGTWGEAQYFHAPAPVGTVPLGTSPPSPEHQQLWIRPLVTIHGWAAS